MRVWAAAAMAALLASCRQAAPRLPPLDARPLAEGPAAAVGALPGGAWLAGGGERLWIARRDGATASVQPDYGPLKVRLQEVRDIACRGWRCAVADPAGNRVWDLVLAEGCGDEACPATLRSLAGSGTAFYPIGDGVAAPSAQVDAPQGVAWLRDGSAVLSDTGHGRVRVVGLDGRIATLAGTGLTGEVGDGGPAAKATLMAPGPLAVGPDGALLVAETGAPRVRRIGPDHRLIDTISGDRVAALAVTPDGLVLAALSRQVATIGSEGGQVAAFNLHGPTGLAIGEDGTIAVADTDRVVLLEPRKR